MRRGELEVNLAFALGPIALMIVATSLAMLLQSCVERKHSESSPEDLTRTYPRD